MAESEPGSAPERFEALFEAQHDAIWSFVRRRVNDRSEADDLTSEVFLVAWRRFADLPPPEEQRLWLFGVARNVLHNHRRSINRQQRLLDRIRRQPRRDVVHLDEGDDALWRALARLSDDARDLLIMRAWDELAVQDIAVLLDCTPNAVSLRLRKARAALEAELGVEGQNPTEKQNDRIPSGHVVHQPTSKGES